MKLNVWIALGVGLVFAAFQGCGGDSGGGKEETTGTNEPAIFNPGPGSGTVNIPVTPSSDAIASDTTEAAADGQTTDAVAGDAEIADAKADGAVEEGVVQGPPLAMINPCTIETYLTEEGKCEGEIHLRRLRGKRVQFRFGLCPIQRSEPLQWSVDVQVGSLRGGRKPRLSRATGKRQRARTSGFGELGLCELTPARWSNV